LATAPDEAISTRVFDEHIRRAAAGIVDFADLRGYERRGEPIGEDEDTDA
jgi:hypothetical protein